jgi:hypothetical protein
VLFLLGEPVYIGGVTATFKACIRFRVAGDLLNIRVTTIRRLVPLLFVFWFMLSHSLAIGDLELIK